MATLYRPKVATYKLRDGSYRTPDGKRVTKDTPGAVKVVTKSAKWYGRYTDGAGVQHRVPLSEDKTVARRMLAKLAGDSQLAGVGIPVPDAEAARKPLACPKCQSTGRTKTGQPCECPDGAHLTDFRRYLAAKGNTKDHVARTCRRIGEVLDGCKFTLAADLGPGAESAVVEYLAALQKRGRPRIDLPAGKDKYTRAELAAVLSVHPASVARLLKRDGLAGTGKGKARRYGRDVAEALQARLCNGTGVTTCNHYLTAVKGFTRWLDRQNRIPADPLSHLTRKNPDVDVRCQRRALPGETFARFIEAAGAGGEFRGLTGPDRLVIYTLAANTGFRAGELASLTPASFRLDGARPTVTVRAAYSKRRREDVQPLRADVAEMMRQYIAGRPRRDPLWPGGWREDAAEVVRHDLEAAGIAYQDEEGRTFDFHAMRGQFISLLAANGVHPKVAQTLARHSTITLTMDYYTHLDVLDLTGALDKLPPVDQGKARPDGEKAADGGKAQARRLEASA